jgi:hypothetical protein
MSTFARNDSIRRPSTLCLLAMLAACGGKGGPGTDATGDTDAMSSGTTAAGADTTGTGTSTTSEDTAVITGSDGGNPCVSTCASEENCTIDESASTGVGSDSCDENFHCVVRMDCSCILSFCEPDCDPADPMTCEEGKTCDAGTGRCV